MNPQKAGVLNKRKFLKTIVMSGCILSIKGYAYADNALDNINYVKFGKDIFIDRVGENEWSIRSRLLLLNKVDSYNFSVLIQIATDPSFSQIIHEDEIPLQPGGERSLWYRYRSQYSNSELFVRFALIGNKNTKTKGLEKQGMGQEMYSNTGSISPWNN